MYDIDWPFMLLIRMPVFFLSASVHEFFHAYAAYRFGDSTAKDLGRLTFNPIAHIDIWGVLAFVVSGFRFGWAKPVPVNTYNLRDPRRNHLWIAAAGPLSNIGLAIIAGIMFRFVYNGVIPLPDSVSSFLYFAVRINLALAFFNMIPLFPLDGSHVLGSLLPERFDEQWSRFNMMAPFILIGMVFMGGIWLIIGAPVDFFTNQFSGY